MPGKERATKFHISCKKFYKLLRRLRAKLSSILNYPSTLQEIV
jgi:hypothetical protein